MDIQSLLNLRPPLTILNPNILTVSSHITLTPLFNTSKRKNIVLLTRDQLLQVQTLCDNEWSVKEITRYLNQKDIICIEKQIQYAETNRSTSKKRRCNVKSIFNTSARQRIVGFVTSFKRTR